MPDNLETLCHLVETRAAKHGIVRLYLWEWALIAVRDRVLPYKVSGDVWKNANPLDDAIEYDPLSSQHLPSERPPSEHEHRAVRAKAGWYLADKRYDPCQSWWWKLLLIAPEAFDKWIKEENRTRQFPAHQKRTSGRKSLAKPLADFLKERYPGGLPPGLTNKQIVALAKDKIGIVSLKTVGRAKKLAFDGTN